MSNTGWRTIDGERTIRLGVFAVRLVDAFTGTEPIGMVQSTLELRNPDGSWKGVNETPTRTSNGAFAFSLLAVSDNPARIHPGSFASLNDGDFPSVGEFRVKFETELYMPSYLPQSDAFEPSLKRVSELLLYPAPNYPFPDSARVARGLVTDSNGSALSLAEVLATNPPGGSPLVEEIRSVSNSNGEFAIPVIRTLDTTTMRFEATDASGTRSAFVDLSLATALSQLVQITIN
jgi:hypothetical protein